MKIDIICPLYQAEKYILNLHKSIKLQEDVEINKINYILTESSDSTEKILQENEIEYKKIKKEEFSHSLTREKVAMQSTADIIAFITQDIIIKDNKWLRNLTKCIENDECEASYSKQICNNNTIEKYTRERNYPENSFIVSKSDLNKKGLQTFFFSDASSAIKKEIFISLNGYDGKDLPTNEDMYFAYKLIMNGYKIKYCANSVVEHSHKFTLKQLYKRYYDTGVFFQQNNYLDKYGTKKSGGSLAKYILKRALQDKNVKVLIRFFPDMIVRLKGMNDGKRISKKNRNFNYKEKSKIAIILGSNIHWAPYYYRY